MTKRKVHRCLYCKDPLPPDSAVDKLYCNGTCANAHATQGKPRSAWGVFLRGTLKGGMYHCPWCPTQVRRMDNISEHIRRYHRDRIPGATETCLFCGHKLDIADLANGAIYCGQVCANAYDRLGPKRDITGDGRGERMALLIERGLYRCPYPDCDEGFPVQQSLRAHVEAAHNVQLAALMRYDNRNDGWGEVWDSQAGHIVYGYEPQFVEVVLRERSNQDGRR